MIELKPCPFCGGAARLFGDHRIGYYAACSPPLLDGQYAGCHAAIGEAYDRDATPDHEFRDEESAAAAWNRRATPSPQGDAEDDWTEFGKRFAIDLNNTLAAAEMVHKGAGEGPYEALLIGIELLAQHARLAMRRRGDA